MVRSRKMKSHTHTHIQECNTQIENQAPADIVINTATVEEIQREIEERSPMIVNQRDNFILLLFSSSQGKIWVVLSTERNFWERTIVAKKDYYYLGKDKELIFIFSDHYLFRTKSIFWFGKIVGFNPLYITYSGLVYEGEK